MPSLQSRVIVVLLRVLRMKRTVNRMRERVENGERTYGPRLDVGAAAGGEAGVAADSGSVSAILFGRRYEQASDWNL